jgi:DNA-binding CsgD family transcriptional regulator
MLDEKSNLEIAREIGITPKIVSDIRRGITWRHV